MFDVTKFLASAQRTKGTGEIPTGAESKAKIVSPARMLFFEPNSAPNSWLIQLIEALGMCCNFGGGGW